MVDRRLLAAQTGFIEQRGRIVGGGRDGLIEIIQMFLRQVAYLLG